MTRNDNARFPTLDPKRTGENIRAWREKKRVSAEELKKFLGLSSRNAIYQWERGIAIPTVDNLYAVSQYLGISMETLLAETQNDEETDSRVDGKS